MKNKSLILAVRISMIAVLVTSMMMLGRVTKVESEEKTIKIGFMYGLTGWGSQNEILCRDGSLMAVDWINEKGGITIRGQKYLIEPVVEDIKGDIAGSLAAAEKLVNQHRVKFIVGAVVPPFTQAAGQVTEKAHVLRSLPYSAGFPDTMGPRTPYTFLSNSGSLSGIVPTLDYLLEIHPKVKTIGLMVAQDGAEEIIASHIKEACKPRGLDLVASVPWGFDTIDFQPLMTKLLASKPDAISLMNGWDMALGQMIKASRKIGFKGPIVGMSFESVPNIIQVAGADLVEGFFNHGMTNDPNDPLMPKETKFVADRAMAKYGKFDTWYIFGWNPLWTLVQAIEHAQSLDTTEVANTWRKMDKIQTCHGLAKMGGQKTYGIKNAVCNPILIAQAVNGKAKIIKIVDNILP